MYHPSELTEEKRFIRKASFTRWLALDFHQAAVDFQRSIGLMPLYLETDPDNRRRAIFICYPRESHVAARSGRKEEQFLTYDAQYRQQHMSCLTLHVSVEGLYSAVWCSDDQRSAILPILENYGISPTRSS